MSAEEQAKWDRRYAERAGDPLGDANPFLGQWLERLAELGVRPGRALDLASGRGANAMAMAQAGWDVTAVDISAVGAAEAQTIAEERGLAVRWVVADLDDRPVLGDDESTDPRAATAGDTGDAGDLAADLAGEPASDPASDRAGFDLITVFRYRNPGMWPWLLGLLAPEGWVVTEHHLRTARSAAGPADHAFRLAPGELLGALDGLRVLLYEERFEVGSPPTVLARAVACAGDPRL